MPSGSYVAISHASNPRDGSETAEQADAIEAKFKTAFPSLNFRTPDETSSLFTGLELVDPGVVTVFDWWPPGAEDDNDLAGDLPVGVSRVLYVGLARKP